MTQDEGVIVNRIPFSESSYIVSWIARDSGLVKTLAKGAKRARQPFFGKIDLLYQCSFAFVAGQGAQLFTLTDIEIIDPRREIGSSYPKQLAAAYCFEVIAALVEPMTPVPEHYELFVKLLDYLATHEPGWELVERFERRVLGVMGLNDSTRSMIELRHDHYTRMPKSYPALERQFA
jgi:DNA repair protein RecO (recombination protein O)